MVDIVDYNNMTYIPLWVYGVSIFPVALVASTLGWWGAVRRHRRQRELEQTDEAPQFALAPDFKAEGALAAHELWLRSLGHEQAIAGRLRWCADEIKYKGIGHHEWRQACYDRLTEIADSQKQAVEK